MRGKGLVHTQRVLVEGVSNKVRLEERAHLGIARTGVVEYQKVHLEGCHVDHYRQHNEACDASSPVPNLVALGRRQLIALMALPTDAHTTGIFRSPNFSQRSSRV